METVLAIRGEDFVLVAADKGQARSIVVMKDDDEKLTKLGTHGVLASAGPPADRATFSEYISRNIALHELRQGHTLSPQEIASFTRQELAQALRRAPYQVNVIVSGFNQYEKKPAVYWLDYLGSMHEMNFAVHGHASYFALALLDSQWRPGMDQQTVESLFFSVAQQLQKRFLIKAPAYDVWIVDRDGIRELPNLHVSQPVAAPVQ